MSLFKKSKILVIGDAMLDKYIFGTIDRISPEAPVPVLKVQKEILKPGGAANVAANVCSLGIETNLVANVGKDNNGKVLSRLIKNLKINSASEAEEYVLKKYKYGFQPMVNKDDIFITIKNEEFIIDCIKKIS